jgi:FAD/FMN-containing dehydrogenase
VLWKELNRETQLHGLAVTGGVVGTTGIAGLTLGGGLGWLMPKYGLALDNLRSVEMVMADGSVKRAAADENPDLFWAVRGGGGNFGIASSFEYNLHQVGPTIAGGLVAHPFPNARNVLRFFRETCATLPDEMMMAAGLLTAPDGSGNKLVGVLAAHCGSLADGEAALKPIKAFGAPVLDAMGPISYCQQNGLLDASLPKGALNYWKSHFLTDLSDDAIDAIIEAFVQCPSPMSQIVIEHFHGAASRVPVQDTACAMRITGFNVVLIAQWMDLADNDRHIAWCRDTYAKLAPYLGETRYVNYMDHDEAGDPAAIAYGPNYARLRDLKTKYDAENVFHINVNIRPR